MGYIKKKICSKSGCNEIALPNSAYCEAHQPIVSRDTTSRYKQFYAKSWWRKQSRIFLTSHIWCEICAKQGRHNLANVVHHSQGFCDWESFCDISKWQAVCKSCHSTIHSKITNDELWSKRGDK